MLDRQHRAAGREAGTVDVRKVLASDGFQDWMEHEDGQRMSGNDDMSGAYQEMKRHEIDQSITMQNEETDDELALDEQFLPHSPIDLIASGLLQKRSNALLEKPSALYLEAVRVLALSACLHTALQGAGKDYRGLRDPTR